MEKILKMIENNPSIISTIENPTDEMKLLAVRKNGLTLEYIKNPTEEMKEIAIENNPNAIKYIENPTENMMLKAIEYGWSNLKYIENPTEEAKKLAVSINYEALRYIKNPSYDIESIAIKNNEASISFINLDKEKMLGFLKANISVIKYIVNKVTNEEVEEVLKDVLSKEDVSEKYVRDFINSSVIGINSSVNLDKILFVYKYGSKKAKKITVDEKLKF